MTTHGHNLSQRMASALLLSLMVLGSFALWLAVPAGILWGLGRLVDTKTEHFLLALLVVPLGMIVCGVALAWLNTIYLQVNGFRVGEVDEDEPWKPRLRAPLDRIIGICAVVALSAFLVWMIFGDTGTGPVSPW